MDHIPADGATGSGRLARFRRNADRCGGAFREPERGSRFFHAGGRRVCLLCARQGLPPVAFGSDSSHPGNLDLGVAESGFQLLRLFNAVGWNDQFLELRAPGADDRNQRGEGIRGARSLDGDDLPLDAGHAIRERGLSRDFPGLTEAERRRLAAALPERRKRAEVGVEPEE